MASGMGFSAAILAREDAPGGPGVAAGARAASGAAGAAVGRRTAGVHLALGISTL
jgi:hypothetical protein